MLARGLLLALFAAISFPHKVEAQDFAVVSTQLIYPGQIVEATSLEIVDASYCPNCDPGFYSEVNSIVGMVAVRSLLPGRLIFPSDLKPAPAVLRGREVTVVYSKGKLRISMTGVPLEDAAIHEEVPVRNARSGATVTGVVQPDGTVAVMQ